MTEHTVTVHFTPRFGAVDRIISVLRRRGFPVAGMTLERTHDPAIERMTVAIGEAAAVEQVSRHLTKLPDVIEVHTGGDEGVRREFALLRVRCSEEERAALETLLAAHDGRILNAQDAEVAIEVCGTAETIDRLFRDLMPYGITESARTGTMTLHTNRPANVVAPLVGAAPDTNHDAHP